MTTDAIKQLQDLLWERGTTPHQWARENGFVPKTVYEFYRAEMCGKPIRGPVATRIRRKLGAFLRRPLEGVETAFPHGPDPVVAELSKPRE
jgi:uncharacterized protein YcaQ